MSGTSGRSIRLATLFLIFLASHAFADAPVTSYACAPGKAIDGVGCSCPKTHAAARDSGDEGRAICTVATRSKKLPKRTQDITVTITGTRIVVNGVELSSTPQLADFEALYGKPDRVWEKPGAANRIHTWDKLGVLVYEPAKSARRATSMTLPFRPMETDFSPSKMFAGKITVDGYSFKAASKFDAAKARPGATQPYGDTSIVFAKGDFNVFLLGSKGAVDLVELGLWTKPPPPPADKTVDSAPADGKTVDSAPADGKTVGIAPADVKVAVTTAGSVTLLGQEIGGKPMLADIKKILGEPSRVWDKKDTANRIHIWDNLGLIVYEPRNGRVTSITLPYKAMSSEFSPTTLFNGRVSLDGKGLYKFNTIGTVKQRPNATQPYGQDTVVFDVGDVRILAKAPAATTETLDLVDVSFWQKKE